MWWEDFSPEYFGFTLPASPPMLPTYLMSSASKIRPFKAAVTKAFNLTPPQQLGTAETVSSQ
jgi:hypothetical protein